MQRKLALFTRHPHCSLQCCNGVIGALSPYYRFMLFNENQCEGSTLDDVDMVVFPGGVGDSDSYHRFFRNRRRVKFITEYVRNGGRYLGICMGAYWAGSNYFDILTDVDAVQYIKRSGADIRRSYGTVAPVIWKGQPHNMYFYDGCTFENLGGEYQTVASYKNNDPAAIIQNNIGLIGPHPESDTYWYSKPYMKSYWHEYQHHTLLSDFAKKLFN